MAIIKLQDFIGNEKVVNQPAKKPQVDPMDSFLKGIPTNISTDIKTAGEGVESAISGTGSYEGKGAIERGFGAVSEAASGLNNVVADVIPGAKTALEYIGKGAEKIANLNEETSNKLSQIFGYESPRDWAVRDPKGFKNLSSVLGTVASAGNIAGTIAGAEGMARVPGKIKGVSSQVISKVDEALSPAINYGKEAVSNVVQKITPESATIMNRVARLNPTDAKMFENLSGKTVGKYLEDTGNFGTPESIISKEASKFTQSVKSVDDALAKLPGTFEDGSVSDALKGLSEKAKSTSGDSVKSPYLKRVAELEVKHSTKGLTMEEINEVKRLYEKNVKLGYNKLTNADAVERATNIDNALREWQVNKAAELGFKNIADVNKQTQLSRFITDKLGEKLIGQSGLNGVNLTDWVVLAGGDPTAVSAFLAKKFFSSKSVQAKIAEILKKGDVEGIVAPQIGPSSVPRLPAGNTSVPNLGAVEAAIPMYGETTLGTQVKLPSRQVKRASERAFNKKKR